jgi:hypothetical protein
MITIEKAFFSVRKSFVILSLKHRSGVLVNHEAKWLLLVCCDTPFLEGVPAIRANGLFA